MGGGGFVQLMDSALNSKIDSFVNRQNKRGLDATEQASQPLYVTLDSRASLRHVGFMAIAGCSLQCISQPLVICACSFKSRESHSHVLLQPSMHASAVLLYRYPL